MPQAFDESPHRRAGQGAAAADRTAAGEGDEEPLLPPFAIASRIIGQIQQSSDEGVGIAETDQRPGGVAEDAGQIWRAAQQKGAAAEGFDRETDGRQIGKAASEARRLMGSQFE